MRLGVLITALLLNLAIRGQGWSSLGTGVDDFVDAFAGDSTLGELYVGGNFQHAGILPYERFGLWGGAWDPSINSGPNGPIYAMTMYNGDIFVGGDFDSIGNLPANNIAEWNGTWRTVGGGVNKPVYALKSFGNYLFVGGEFDTVSPAPYPIAHIATWDGSIWNRVAVTTDPNGPVKAIEFLNGELFIGGGFTSVGGITVSNIAKLNGSGWDALNNGVNNEVLALQVYNGELYAGGKFTQVNGNAINYIAKWSGSNWNQIGSGTSGSVTCFTGYNNLLVAGGTFVNAGGMIVNNIATWNGVSWSDLSGGTDSEVDGLISFYGDLYVGGKFANAGGIPCANVAKWNSPTAIYTVSKNNSENLAMPNPFSISTSLNLSDWVNKKYTFQIYNNLGEEVKSASYQEGEKLIIEKGGLKAGVYHYRLISTGGKIKSGKLIMQD